MLAGFERLGEFTVFRLLKVSLSTKNVCRNHKNVQQLGAFE